MTRPKTLTAEEERCQRLTEATLVLVSNEKFVAALLIHRGEILCCAPSLERWVQNRRTAGEVLDQFRKQGWRVDLNPILR